MEEYPGELRTPPVNLISLVGCPEAHQIVSAHIHSEQPPVNVLALPDFSNISFLEKKAKDSGADNPPAGIIKRDWLSKYRTKVPSVVAALFSSDHVSGGPDRWLELCTHLDQLKAVIRARNIKLVVIVVHSSAKVDIVEDRMIALRKRAEVDPKYVVHLFLQYESELKQSLIRLGCIFAELACMYFRDEGRRVKSRLEKKNFGSTELAVRCCFKVAVYAEFRKDWVEALKFYEDAYHALKEMVGSSAKLPATQRLVEIKAVAEQVHFKISTLLLHGGRIVEAVRWFHQHCQYYKKLSGSPDVTFMHWEWMSRQFLVFAELLEKSSRTVPGFPSLVSAAMDKALTDWELQPAYYYQLASHYLKQKKSYLELAISLLDSADNADGMAESVIPSTYVGQFARMLEQKDDAVTMQHLNDEEFAHYAIAEGKRFQDSFEIIALLRKSYDMYNGLKAVRMASYCAFDMGREYFSAGDTKKSKECLDSAINFYRQEGWITLLWEALSFLRECSRRDVSLREFVEYSLEMAALPISSVENAQSFTYRDVGPAGPPSFRQRELILKEVLSFATAEPGSPSNESDGFFHATERAPLHLEVDLVSPLRVALLASVAFHEQMAKPGMATLFTLSLLSQLPLSIEIDALEIQFNQSNCNFTLLNAEKSASVTDFIDQPGHRCEIASALTLAPSEWLRLTFDVKSERSGKLECVSIIVRVGSHLTICCRAESPATLGELPLWKYEERLERLPTKDPVLSLSGQKAIQVDEPDPLLDLNINAQGPGLVGETFILPICIASKGHAVYSGELKINLVDNKGGGLASPREIDSHASGTHHVEILAILGSDPQGKSQMNIKHSFGLVSVPFLRNGDSWSCRLEMRWNRPKPIMLFVSLGYSPYGADANAQQVHVHRSLEIEGKIPFSIGHNVMPPFRRDPLLLSRLKPPLDSQESPSLPLNETSILAVRVKNCTEVPLRLLSISTTRDDDDGPEHYSGTSIVLPATNTGSDPAISDLLVPGEEYKKLFSVKPTKISPKMNLGKLSIRWQRGTKQLNQPNNSVVLTEQTLPDLEVEFSPLVMNLECPSHAILGHPFTFFIKIQNQTELLQEVRFSLMDSLSFVSAGSHSDTIFVLPRSAHVLSYKLVPLSSGLHQLPRATLTAMRYSAGYQPSVASSSIFVFPSKPKFKSETATSNLDRGIPAAE